MKVRANNPTLPLARQVAAARLKRAGFTKLKFLRRNVIDSGEYQFPESLIAKLAGG